MHEFDWQCLHYGDIRTSEFHDCEMAGNSMFPTWDLNGVARSSQNRAGSKVGVK